jgi:thioredoxin 1
MIRKLLVFLLSAGLMIWLASAFIVSNPVWAQAGNHPQIPAAEMPTVLDLGATACVPCKMMAPILEKLEKEYRGRAAVIFVDVWNDQTEAKRFGIRTIPTQIFFDKSGNEFWRHEGFLDEETIVTVLDALIKKSRVEPVTEIRQNTSLPDQPGTGNRDNRFQIDTYTMFFTGCGVILLLIAGWVLWELRRNRRIRSSD